MFLYKFAVNYILTIIKHLAVNLMKIKRLLATAVPTSSFSLLKAKN